MTLRSIVYSNLGQSVVATILCRRKSVHFVIELSCDKDCFLWSGRCGRERIPIRGVSQVGWCVSIGGPRTLGLDQEGVGILAACESQILNFTQMCRVRHLPVASSNIPLTGHVIVL